MNIDAKSMVLFVVSQIGQVRRAQELARKLEINDAVLVIFFTKRNPHAATIAAAEADPAVFARIERLEIDPFSNELSLSAATRAEVEYGQLLERLRPSEVFVCSFERHYAVLCSEAHRRGIKLSLYEEGTAIYKGAVEGFQTFGSDSLFVSIENIYKKFWRDQAVVKYIIAPLVRIIAGLPRIPSLIFLSIRELYNIPHIQRGLLKKKNEAFLSGWKIFSRIFASNTPALRKAFEANAFIDFPPTYLDEEFIERAKFICAHHRINSQTAIFASQQFPFDAKVFASTLISVLETIAVDQNIRILMKLHPREKPSNVVAYRSEIAKLGDGCPIEIIDDESVPAEYLVIYSDCVAVISISSSTLMYAPRYKPVRAISIGRHLRDVLINAGVYGKGVELIDDHAKILDQFDYIEHYAASVLTNPNARPPIPRVDRCI